jgi:hypothetical protein
MQEKQQLKILSGICSGKFKIGFSSQAAHYHILIRLTKNIMTPTKQQL